MGVQPPESKAEGSARVIAVSAINKCYTGSAWLAGKLLAGYLGQYHLRGQHALAGVKR
jgi:hypothetical protein